MSVGGEVQGGGPGISIISLLVPTIWGPYPMLSLKLPSSTWVGALVPAEELRDMYQIAMYNPWGGTRTLTHPCTSIS